MRSSSLSYKTLAEPRSVWLSIPGNLRNNYCDGSLRLTGRLRQPWMPPVGGMRAMTSAQDGWIISTVAGTGTQGCSGDGGPAAAALLNNPFDLAFDPAGNLIFSDTFNHRICRIDARTQVIGTVAGTGERGFGGDGGPAIAAKLNEPYGVVVDADGRIFFADRLNRRVRVV